MVTVLWSFSILKLVIAEDRAIIADSNDFSTKIEKTNGPFDLTDKYTQQAKKIGEQRVELAGARLANLLNTELK